MRLTARLTPFAVAALIATGCGGSSDDSNSPTTTAPSQAAESSATYRAAVNDLFDAVLAARGSYQAAHGATALRSSAEAIAKADAVALARLKTIGVPSSAQALQSELVKLLTSQRAELTAILSESKLDSAKLGDAVLMSNDVERLVNEINTLP